LSVDAFHARSTSDGDAAVTRRFLGVDGGVVSAAEAGGDTAIVNASRSATIAAASSALLRSPRALRILRTP
jgi:hypothetical protein